MHEAPKTDAVVRGCLHTLVDDFCALGVAIEVVHYIEQAVNETDGRLIFVQGFQCESPSLQGSGCLFVVALCFSKH